MKKISSYLCVLFIAAFLGTIVCSQANANSKIGGIAGLIAQVKQAVMFLGHQEVQANGTIKNVYEGTGCLISIDNIFHILTAKHVATRKGKNPAEDMLVFLNRKDGTVSIHSFSEIKIRFGVDWVLHPDPDVDLAMIPIALDPTQDLFKVVPQELFQSPEKLYELYDVFFLSYQPGAVEAEMVSPVVRTATLSMIKSDGTFLIDGNTFPGNSGSPVFLKPSAIRFDSGGISLGDDPLGGKFIGIVGAYLPYREVAVSMQTGRPRVVFEENTGLSIVSSVKLIQSLIDSASAQTQLKKLKER